MVNWLTKRTSHSLRWRVGLVAFIVGVLFVTGCSSEPNNEATSPPSAQLSCNGGSSGFSSSIGGSGGSPSAEEALIQLPQEVAGIETKPGQAPVPTTGFVSTGDEESDQRVFAHIDGGRTTATVEVIKSTPGGWFITGMNWCI
jgi:uncharacterized lipoprotein YajG